MKRLRALLKGILAKASSVVQKTVKAGLFSLIIMNQSVSANSEEKAQLKIGINNIVPSMLTTDGLKLSSDSKPLSGSAAEIYQCVFDSLSIKYELSMLPVGRLELLLESGEVDIGALVAQTPERDQYAIFSEGLFKTNFIIVTHKNRIPDDHRFSNWNLSVALNTVFHDIAKSKFDATLYPTSSWNSAMSMLNKKRVDGVFLADQILELDVSPLLTKDLNIFKLDERDVGLYLSKRAQNSEQLLERLNQAVRACRTKYPQ